MLNKKRQKFLAILMILAITVTTVLPLIPPKEVSAAFIGNDGALPGGGTLGKGGGMCSATSYRIGISTEPLSTQNAFTTDDDNDTVTTKLEKHFSNHMANLQNSIMFIPDECYTQNSAIGWYQSSSGQLIVNKRNITGVSSGESQERIAIHDAKVRNLKPTNNDPAPGGLFYNALLAKAPLSKPGDLSAFKDDGWKSIATSVPNYSSKSKAVWDYIFGRKEDIPIRLKEYIGEALMDTDRSARDHHSGELHYIDLMITLYMLSPTGEQRDFYSTAIKNFVNKKDLDKSPILFAVDTVVRFSSPAQLGGTYVYIPSSGYVDYMHGSTPSSSITNPNFKPNLSGATTTKNLIVASAKQSMADVNRERKTDLPESTDGFTWAYSGVVGDALRTNSANQTATWRTSDNVGVMESIFFTNSSYFGFMVAGGPNNKPSETPNCECAQTVSIVKKDIEGKLEGNVVGKKLPLLINMKQNDPKKLADWKTLLNDASNLKIKVRLWRSQAPGTPTWGPTGAKPIPIDGNASGADAHWDTITKAQLLKYLADGTPMQYEDDLTAYNIADDVNQEFKYNASIAVKGVSKSGEEFLVECTADDSLSMFVEGPTPPEPAKGSYSSTPEYWSEIKQGSPGNEEFEAMAGTPTTRDLYFASGGSEFIVDIDVEYVPDMTSTRTYRSYFTGGVPSEFKLGDQAPSKTVGGQSVNPHTGGSVTKSWSGSIPWTGTHSASGYHGGGVTNTWDYNAQKAALAEATAWAAEVNGTVIDHTAASDGVNRKFSAWGASVQGSPSEGAAGTWTDGADPVAPVACSGNPCTGGSPGKPGVDAKSTAGTAGSYSYTVTGTVPAQIIDGPSSVYDLPPLEDTWTQEVNYDYTKITDVNVWKIDRSKVNGMIKLTSTDEVTASITQGDPTVFYNIAEEGKLPTQASAEGRLRYSLEPDQHDVVVWNEGPRTNKDDGRGRNNYISGPGQTAPWATGSIYTNIGYSNVVNYHVTNSTAEDKNTTEWKKFDERRKSLTKVTAISDFLILQTSSGDQSVMYFDKTTPIGIESQKRVEIPKTSFDTQWTNNSLSAAKWDEKQVNIGSYNGKYQTPNAKYSKTGTAKVPTIFDPDYLPAGLDRTPRPTSPLLLVKTGIDVIDTIPNGEYITGVSDIFYSNIIKYGTKPAKFSVALNSKYAANGVEFGTTYSNDHSKVNDLVIHDPVSVQGAIVLPLPSSRDQRTDNTKMIGGNLQEPTFEYERRLKPGYVFTPSPAVYETRTVPNPNYVPATAPVDNSFNYTGAVQTFTATKAGTYTLETWGAEGGTSSSGLGGAGGYVKGNIDLASGQTLSIYVGGKGGDKTGAIDQYDGLNNNGGWNGGGSGSGNAGPGGGGATDIRTSGGVVETPIYNWDFVNSTLGFGSGTTAISAGTNVLDGIISNSDGFFYSPTISTVGQADDVVEIRVKNNSSGANAQIYFDWGSGYSDSYVSYFNMTTNDSDYKVYRVPVGSHSYWNGRTIRSMRFDLANDVSSGTFYVDYIKVLRSSAGGTNNRIIVAGGGGAGNHSYNYGGNITNLTSTAQGADGCTGWTSGNTYEYDNGGGGGGYLGGQASCSDDGRIGYGGSNYAGGVTNTSMQNGVRTGNGLARITVPGAAGVGSPTMEVEVLVSPAITEPPDDAYEYVKIVHDPAAPVDTPLGSYTPGNFINLDYPFSVSFPNVGDFYGDGALGLRYTTATPGKGFVNNMNTTEWTKSKQVKFDFFVTYEGRTYAPDTWIDLPVGQTTFDFYLPLANSEAISALVQFRAIAINASFPDGDQPTNKIRYSNLAANHSALKGWNIDIVGRIGALVLEDTGDYRFSNLFKKPLSPTEWLIPNVVKKVNGNQQNFIVGDTVDIRGNAVTSDNGYLDTYGLLPTMRQNPIPLPLSPDKNNIASLRKQPMRLGYNTFSDVQTIGNYYNKLQVIPYYYSMNVNTGTITPVDVYMSVNNSYKPINKFGAAVPGWDPKSVYQYIYSLDWNAESGRRNYTEAANTNHIVEDSTLEDDLGNVTSLGKPLGNKYPFGTAQVMYLTERNRTFIGTNVTNGIDRNPGSVIPSEEFGKQGQRWHFTYGLPSSAVAVPKDQSINQSNIDLIKNNQTVLVVALDIKSVGNTYALQYSKANGSVTFGGKSFSLSSIPYPVVTVYAANKSSADDLSTSGTH